MSSIILSRYSTNVKPLLISSEYKQCFIFERNIFLLFCEIYLVIFKIITFLKWIHQSHLWVLMSLNFLVLRVFINSVPVQNPPHWSHKPCAQTIQITDKFFDFLFTVGTYIIFIVLIVFMLCARRLKRIPPNAHNSNNFQPQTTICGDYIDFCSQ